MKATIIGQPAFEIEITKELVHDLMRCAQGHYDVTCRKAADPGGVLSTWLTMLGGEPPSKSVIASFRNVDLTLKICEAATVIFRENPERLSRVREYADTMAGALRLASNIQQSGAWEIEIPGGAYENAFTESQVRFAESQPDSELLPHALRSIRTGHRCTECACCVALTVLEGRHHLIPGSKEAARILEAMAGN